MSAFALPANGQSNLPKAAPAGVEISFHQDAGMIHAYKKINIAGNVLTYEELKDNQKNPVKWTIKIPAAEQSSLYALFVENNFDLIKNEEREGIVYDAGSETVFLKLDQQTLYSVSYGANSPLSKENTLKYQQIANAIRALSEKYKSKGKKTKK
jgi:hypothetical protein